MKRLRPKEKDFIPSSTTRNFVFENIALPATRAFFIAKMNGATDEQARMATSSATIAYLTARGELTPQQIAFKTIKAVASAIPNIVRATHMLVPSMKTEQEKKHALSVAATMIGRAAANSIPNATKEAKQVVDMMTKQQVVEDTLTPKTEMQGSGLWQWHTARGGSSDFSWLSYASGGGLDDFIGNASDALGYTYKSFLLTFFPIEYLLDASIPPEQIAGQIVTTNNPAEIEYALYKQPNVISNPGAVPSKVFLPVMDGVINKTWADFWGTVPKRFAQAIQELRDINTRTPITADDIAPIIGDQVDRIQTAAAARKTFGNDLTEGLSELQAERDAKEQEEKNKQRQQDLTNLYNQAEGSAVDAGATSTGDFRGSVIANAARLESLFNTGRTYGEMVQNPNKLAYVVAAAQMILPGMGQMIAKKYNEWDENSKKAQEYSWQKKAREAMEAKPGFDKLTKDEQDALIYREYKRKKEADQYETGWYRFKKGFWGITELAANAADKALNTVLLTGEADRRRVRAEQIQKKQEKVQRWANTIGYSIAAVSQALPPGFRDVGLAASKAATEGIQLFGPTNAEVQRVTAQMDDITKQLADPQLSQAEKDAKLKELQLKTTQLESYIEDAKIAKAKTGLDYKHYKGELDHQDVLRKEDERQKKAETKIAENTAKQQEKENEATNRQNEVTLNSQELAYKSGAFLSSYHPPTNISYAPRVTPVSSINRISPLNTNGIRSLSSLNGQVATHTLKDAKSFTKAAQGAHGVSGLKGIDSYGKPEKKRGRKGDDDSDNDDNEDDSGYKGKPGRKSKFHRYISKRQKEAAKERKRTEKQREKDEKKKQKEVEKAEKKKQKEAEKAEKKQKETFSDAQKAVLLDLIKKAASAAV